MSQREDWSQLEPLDDAQLEQRLLRSAAEDAPPPAASERAFRAFERDARALAALASLGPVPSLERAPQAVPGSAPLAAPARTVQRAALAGLVLGAAAGAGALALWLGAQGGLRARDDAALVPPLPPRPRVAPGTLELRPEPLVPPLAARPLGGAQAARRAGARGAPERAAAERASRLAREVALLDAARAALAIGAGQSTLRQIERYRAEFPRGELAADAEAVAIEALAAEGEHAALAAAARRFLERYPRDPHAARVRELAFIEPPAP